MSLVNRRYWTNCSSIYSFHGKVYSGTFLNAYLNKRIHQTLTLLEFPKKEARRQGFIIFSVVVDGGLTGGPPPVFLWDCIIPELVFFCDLS